MVRIYAKLPVVVEIPLEILQSTAAGRAFLASSAEDEKNAQAQFEAEKAEYIADKGDDGSLKDSLGDLFMVLDPETGNRTLSDVPPDNDPDSHDRLRRSGVVINSDGPAKGQVTFTAKEPQTASFADLLRLIMGGDLPDGMEMCMPGDRTPITVELITPVAIEGGLRFAIREGGRTVGQGVVGEIIE